jgi:hypothetical protein
MAIVTRSCSEVTTLSTGACAAILTSSATDFASLASVCAAVAVLFELGHLLLQGLQLLLLGIDQLFQPLDNISCPKILLYLDLLAGI